MANGEHPLITRVSLLEFQMQQAIADAAEERSVLAAELRSLRDDQNKSSRILYMLLGGVSVVQVVIQFLRH